MKGINRSRFYITQDWKEKVKGSCDCFRGEGNKFGLTHKDKECLSCVNYPLKQMFLGAKRPSGTKFITILIQLNRFNYKEIRAAFEECLPELHYGHNHRKAIHELKKQGYIIFRTQEKIVKAYERAKV